MERTLTEQKVLKQLDITDFSHMTKDKVVEFASLLPRMAPEVAEKALAQFPEYARMATEMVKTYKGIIDEMLAANKADVQNFYDFCNSILTSLQKQLDVEGLSEEARDAINEKMITVARMISDKISENKQFWKDVLGIAGKVLGGIALLAGSVLGVRWLNNNGGSGQTRI